MKHINVNGVLAACPLLFCVYISIEGRHSGDNFVLPTGSRAYDDCVLAYAPFTRRASALFDSPVKGSRTQILELAEDWITAIDKGRLQPFHRVSFEDSILDGERGRIFRYKTKLASYLLKDARRLRNLGLSYSAAREASMALRLSSSMKYSDFTTVYLCGREERAEIGFIESLSIEGGDTLKNQLAQDVARAKINEKQMGMLVRQTKDQYFDWRQRTGHSVDASDVTQLDRMMAAMEQGEPRVETARFVALCSVRDNGLYELLSGLRLASIGEAKTRFAMQRAEGAVSES